MVNYTDIPTGEEQGLISHTVMQETTKKDDTKNLYLKLACVSLLCVVGFLGGSLRSRNALVSMTRYSSGGCAAVSSIKEDGYCKDRGALPCVEYVGMPECVESGGGFFDCLTGSDAREYVVELNELSPAEYFPNGWEVASCNSRGFYKPDRSFDIDPVFPFDFASKVNEKYAVHFLTMIYHN